MKGSHLMRRHGVQPVAENDATRGIPYSRIINPAQVRMPSGEAYEQVLVTMAGEMSIRTNPAG